MNDEIKEILDIENYRNKDGYVENINLSPNEIHKLSDYIINLQNELKYQKEMEDEYIEKHTKLLQDFTNLQEEIEQLTKECIGMKDEIKDLCNKLSISNNIIDEFEEWLKTIPNYFMDTRSNNSGIEKQNGMKYIIDLSLEKLQKLKQEN